MNIGMYQEEAELMQRLLNEIRTTSKRTTIIAEHYAIDSRGTPCVNDDSRASFGIFSEYTMELGCKLLAAAHNNGTDTTLALIVDDYSQVGNRHWYMNP